MSTLEVAVDAPATLANAADAANSNSVFTKRNTMLVAGAALITLGLAFLVWQAMKMYARRRAEEKAKIQSIAAKTARNEAHAELEAATAPGHAQAPAAH